MESIGVNDLGYIKNIPLISAGKAQVERFFKTRGIGRVKKKKCL